MRFRVARFWSKATGLQRARPRSPSACRNGRIHGWPGEWIDGLDAIPYGGLYRLPELIEADPFAPVFIPEGEKCAEALEDLGEVATTPRRRREEMAQRTRR